MILLANSEGSDQTARMRRLILAFAVRICPQKHFAWSGTYILFNKYTLITKLGRILEHMQ